MQIPSGFLSSLIFLIWGLTEIDGQGSFAYQQNLHSAYFWFCSNIYIYSILYLTMPGNYAISEATKSAFP